MSSKTNNPFIDAIHHHTSRRARIAQRIPSPLRESISLDQLQQHEQPISSCNSTPKTAIDVQNLLAAIYRLQKRYRAQGKPYMSVAPNNEDKVLKKALKKVPVKLAKLQEEIPSVLRKALDALASLCSSREDEVVAVGLEAWHAKKTNQSWIRILVATEGQVGEQSKQQLMLIWKSMKDVASVWNRQSVGGMEMEESMKKFVREKQELIADFVSLCMGFVFVKWTKEVNSEIAILLAVPLDDFPKTHPFCTVRENMRRLFTMYTSQNPTIGKPRAEDKKGWGRFTTSLTRTKESIELFMSSDPGFGPKDHSYAHYFPSIERYLQKVTAYFEMVQHLQMTACLPECQDLLKRPFSLYALSAINSIARDVPYTAQDWERVLKKASSTTPERYELDLGVVSKDTECMAKEPVPRDVHVHCELRLVLEAMQRPQTVYAYIGMSKLSCSGCHLFLRVLNDVYGTKFWTRGYKKKARYPWKFPPGLWFGGRITDQMYRLIAQAWTRRYNGYRPRRAHFQSESVLSAPSTVTDDVSVASSESISKKGNKDKGHQCSRSLARSVSGGLRRASSFLGSRRISSGSNSNQRMGGKLRSLKPEDTSCIPL